MFFIQSNYSNVVTLCCMGVQSEDNRISLRQIIETWLAGGELRHRQTHTQTHTHTHTETHIRLSLLVLW